MRVLRLSLEGLGADDRAIYIDQLREHWRLDAWTVAGQLLVLLALGPVIRASGLPGLERFDTVSMGMTGDLEAAVAAGSTMVRVGSGIFGQRNYAPH